MTAKVKLRAASAMTATRFNGRMERLMAYAEHLGIMCGGGWNTRKKTAEFHLEAHGLSCCARMPALYRVTRRLRGKIADWCAAHGLEGTWGHD